MPPRSLATPVSVDVRRRTLLRGLAALGVASPAWALSRQQAEVETEALKVPLAISENLHRPFPTKVLELLGQAANIEWELMWMPFVRVVATAEQGKAFGFGLSHTPERDEFLHFSETMFSTNAWLVGRRDKALEVSTLEELSGHVVCMGRGLKLSAAFDQAIDKDFRVTYGADDRMRTRMLLGKRCDVSVITHRSRRPESVMRRLQIMGMPTSELRMLSHAPLVSMPVSLAIGKDSPLASALPRINDAIRRKTPDIRALIERDLG